MTTFLGSMLLVGAILSCQTGFAQHSSGQVAEVQNGPNATAVKTFFTAFEKKDWSLIQGVLAEGFTFTSPVDDHISIKAFKERCWPNAYKMKRIDLDKLVVNGNNVFIIYNGWTTDGKLFRNCENFKVKDGKISADECFFGTGINYPNSGK